jgi:hypothetical protein
MQPAQMFAFQPHHVHQLAGLRRDPGAIVDAQSARPEGCSAVLRHRSKRPQTGRSRDLREHRGKVLLDPSAAIGLARRKPRTTIDRPEATAGASVQAACDAQPPSSKTGEPQG